MSHCAVGRAYRSISARCYLINGALLLASWIMSELSGERPAAPAAQGSHGGSSLSIFSGVASSSAASGTSELGQHVNVDELTDDSLELLVDDSSKAVRRLTLETQMFEGYYERLISGQLDFKWSPVDGSGSHTKRSSMATITSTSTPESDSVRTSLADISQGARSRTSGDRRRRSGSRTSLGSRGKTLRLSFEQKLGISNKEVERLEADLAHFRHV